MILKNARVMCVCVLGLLSFSFYALLCFWFDREYLISIVAFVDTKELFFFFILETF